MTQAYTDVLKSLSEAYGVSGYEHAVADLIEDQFAPYIDDLSRDAMGNLIMLKRGSPPDSHANDAPPRRKIMLAAHMDENGGMITQIDRGFLNFTNVGGWDRRLLLGQDVVVFGRDGQSFDGVVVSRPPHFAEDRNTYPEFEDYQIDLGLPAETVAENIRVGDVVACKRRPLELLDGLICGKAIDNRASVTAMYVCLRELNRLQHEWDVYALASTQEEVGLRGATTSAYHLNPDVAIAIDVTFANTPGIATGHYASLGKGPVISIGANLHPVMVKTLRNTASKLEMSLQTEPEVAQTGTDAWAIQTARNGIPTGLLGVPMRYMHSTIETINPKDVERVGRLMAYFIADLRESFIDELTPQDGLEDNNAS